MADPYKLKSWQKLAQQKFDEIKEHPDFEEDIEALRKLLRHDIPFINGTRLFIAKYDLPKPMYSAIKDYVVWERFDPSTSMAPVMLISEIDSTAYPDPHPDWFFEVYEQSIMVKRKRRVYLDLNSDTTREDLVDFIDEHWDTIKKKLKILDSSRKSKHPPRLSYKEHYKIIRLYKEKKAAKKRNVYREIEIETKQEPTVIKKVIEKYRRQRKYDIQALLNKGAM